MIFEISNLSFSYNRRNNVLDNLEFNINDGDLIVLLGKNGSGKSTLFNLMLGLNKNYTGLIKLYDKDIKELKEKDIAKLVGYVPQSHDIDFSFTVLEYVLLGLASKVGLFSSPNKLDIDKAIELLKEFGLYNLIDRDYQTLSGGEKQQVTIVRSLLSNPKILILDEPLAHLDIQNQIKILRTIKNLNKKGYTIVLSTHDPNHAFNLNSKVAILNDTKIETGKIDILTEEKLKLIFNENINIRYNDEFKKNICIYKL